MAATWTNIDTIYKWWQVASVHLSYVAGQMAFTIYHLPFAIYYLTLSVYCLFFSALPFSLLLLQSFLFRFHVTQLGKHFICVFTTHAITTIIVIIIMTNRLQRVSLATWSRISHQPSQG